MRQLKYGLGHAGQAVHDYLGFGLGFLARRRRNADEALRACAFK